MEEQCFCIFALKNRCVQPCKVYGLDGWQIEGILCISKAILAQKPHFLVHFEAI